MRYSHLQTLTALWKKLGDAESNDRRAALNVKFPQTPEEFIAIRETAQKLRYAKFLKAPPDQQNYQKLQNGWGEDVQPLLREIHYNVRTRVRSLLLLTSPPSKSSVRWSKRRSLPQQVATPVRDAERSSRALSHDARLGTPTRAIERETAPARLRTWVHIVVYSIAARLVTRSLYLY